MLTTAQVMVLSRMLHRGQKYGDAPYFEAHVERVIRNFPRKCPEIYKQIAYLHGVLEDTQATAKDLIELGVSRKVDSVVEKLTRQHPETYDDYIQATWLL